MQLNQEPICSSNNEPILILGEGGINIAVKVKTFNPVATDSEDIVQFMNPNASYFMSGNGKFVNSRQVLIERLEEEYPNAGNTFTVTFENPGTYNYVYILYPWLTGSVVAEE